MTAENKLSDSSSSIDTIDFPESWGLVKEQGKVRDIYRIDSQTRLLIATDRLSAFDRQVGLIPDRGFVLTGLSVFWFERTRNIVPNHMVEVIDPNVVVVKECSRIDLEMVVRGYNTGVTDTSIWTRYRNGQRKFGDIILPDGMKKNQSLPYPILDPTTKAVVGHDKAILKYQIIEAGIVTEAEYEKIETIALKLFARGEDVAQRAGFILVDTKYEFGRDPETHEIVLIDEIHTPDSSRFWGVNTYEERFAKGEEPDIYDKEFARLWFVSQGYRGEGEPPAMPNEVVDQVRQRYIEVYERLTGKKFESKLGDRKREITENVGMYLGKVT